jgi:Protein of unknown function (DUF992)
MMKKLALSTVAVLLAAGSFLATPAAQAQAGVKVGVLTCQVDPGWGLVLGSSKTMNCSYTPNEGVGDFYTGKITKIGVDVGYTGGGKIIWGVFAPSRDVAPGALEGNYAGVSAQATAGVGVGANVLIGGFDRSITLQPLSVEGNKGLNVAAGIGAISLRQDVG